MGKYDDIIHLPHHVSDYHPQMPMSHRAAQFAPFAALSGHEDAIAETARQTENMKELSEEEITRLSWKLHAAIEKKMEVKIRYFFPDKTKPGGTYKNIKGVIKKWDESENLVILKTGEEIPIAFISEII